MHEPDRQPPTVDPHRATDLARLLADRLEETGDLRSPEWRRAVDTVPRHLFVPRYYEYGPDRWSLTDPVVDPGAYDRWLAAVYSDETLVTQIDGAPLGDRDVMGRPAAYPTSSSTRPSLMLRMLEALNLDAGTRVLEVGTGTGYNAALLAARLGDANVTTVDVDQQVTDAAQKALDAAGYHPTVVTADGLTGHRAAAPYDRVIATCAVRSIPPAWIEQTRPGGQILATVGGGLSSYALARLTVTGNGRAEGGFLPDAASFMFARSQAVPALWRHLRDLGTPASEHDSELVSTVLDDPAFALVAQFALGQVGRVDIRTEDGERQVHLLTHDVRSWARITDAEGRTRVEQSGPRRLWDTVEEVHRAWSAQGRPAPGQLVITAESGHQTVFLPDSPLRWSLGGETLS